MASVNTHWGKGGEREAKIKQKNRVREKQTLLSLLASHFKTSPPPLLGGEFDPCLGGVGNLYQNNLKNNAFFFTFKITQCLGGFRLKFSIRPGVCQHGYDRCYLSHSEIEEFTSEDTAFASKWLVWQGFQKLYSIFGRNLPKKVSNFCSSIANQHHEDFVSPGASDHSVIAVALTLWLV